MTYYTAICFIVCMASVTMMVIVLRNEASNTANKKCFAAVFALILAGTAAQWIAESMNGADSDVLVVHKFVKTLELCIAPFPIYFWIRTVSTGWQQKAVLVLAIVNGVFQIWSAFSGKIYYFDSDSVYQFGDWHFIYTIVYGAAGVLLLAETMKFIGRNQNSCPLPIIAIVTFIVVGMLIPSFFPDIKVSWLVIVMGLSILYNYQNMICEQMDTLTGLLDRRCYEEFLKTYKKPAVFIMLDVDNFKSINDEFGHQTGDECLITIADVIRKTYQKNGLCFRTGGDEFCVALTKNRGIEKINAEFVANLNEARREKGVIVPNVSYGYGNYVPGNNLKEDALREADDMMYKFKNENKIREAAEQGERAEE